MNKNITRKYHLGIESSVRKYTGGRHSAEFSPILKTQQLRAESATGRLEWKSNASRQAKGHSLRIASTAEFYGVGSILHCIITLGESWQQQDPEGIKNKWRKFRRRFLDPLLMSRLVRAGFRVLHAPRGGLMHIHLLLFTSYNMSQHRALYWQMKRGLFSGLPVELQQMIRGFENETLYCGFGFVTKVRTSLYDNPRKVGTYLMSDIGDCARNHLSRHPMIKNKKSVMFFGPKDGKIFRAKLFPPISIKFAQQKSLKAI